MILSLFTGMVCLLIRNNCICLTASERLMAVLTEWTALTYTPHDKLKPYESAWAGRGIKGTLGWVQEELTLASLTIVYCLSRLINGP